MSPLMDELSICLFFNLVINCRIRAWWKVETLTLFCSHLIQMNNECLLRFRSAQPILCGILRSVVVQTVAAFARRWIFWRSPLKRLFRRQNYGPTKCVSRRTFILVLWNTCALMNNLHIFSYFSFIRFNLRATLRTFWTFDRIILVQRPLISELPAFLSIILWLFSR